MAKNKLFQYKFEDSMFLVKTPKELYAVEQDCLGVGYGDKEKFLILVENKIIYNTSNASTWKESFSFIDPLSVDYLIKSDYPQLFFYETHK